MRVTKISSFFIVEYKGYRVSVQRQGRLWVASYQNNAIIAKSKKEAVKQVVQCRLAASEHVNRLNGQKFVSEVTV